ncbi:ribokinase [Aliidongia dinghuensis]|uniref:Ribokinase n=1 Tax=Aliidongia dinghuensis TaxID=1867774 RepID=A0A8J3E2H1_9PROT|nr:ribokinase [Aliidongia dinghuensis]GGF10278.1 ribokinase [Aliidongia dinghuensis]
MILVFGSVNIDLVARVAAIPRPGETVLAGGYETLHGGKGANQAVAAARASLPGRVTLAARVGTDGFGAAALKNLKANGVDVAQVATGPEPTGCAFITVDERAENAITVASGANGALDRSAVAPGALDAHTTAVLQMEVPFGESLAVARLVRAAGGRVIWNFAPVPAGFTAAAQNDLLAATDILVVNEHEATAAAALLGDDGLDFRAAGERLARAGDLTCIVTAGAEGAFVFHADGRRETAAAPPIRPVDTTGAGDTFVGILASGLDEGLPLRVALTRACRGASLACLAAGAQPGMPTRAVLDE